MKTSYLVQTAKSGIVKPRDAVKGRRLSPRHIQKVLDMHYTQGIRSTRRIAEIINADMRAKGSEFRISHTSVWRIINEYDPPREFQLRMMRFAPLLGQ